ncbi:MAG: B12-binding domain-containing protein, partial [Desulfobacterales bacterium]
MMTHKQRMLAAMRGEMVDRIPFVPRLDLWWLANLTKGTIPSKYQGMMPDEISRKEGWACYHMVPNFADISSAEDVLHRSIGLFNFKQSAYGWRFSPDVAVTVQEKDGQQSVEYATPLGSVRTIGGLTEEAQRAGSSIGWVQEHALKTSRDYRVMAYIFENLEVFPQEEGCRQYLEKVGEEGAVAAGGPSLGASPMHLIQKELIEATQFFYAYKDNYRELKVLADGIAVYFDKVLDILADSPAEVILWGANYDEMLTYPPYFEKEILPWLRKASDVLGSRGKILATHTDGENQGLMELIRDSGAHVAESVTPYPMTKVKIEEYYARWRDRITIMGGIPESILLEETASDEEFEAFLDTLFKAVAPGDRLILGTADSTPPNAKFDRLHRIAERVEKEGRLPLAAGSLNPISQLQMERAAVRVSSEKDVDSRLLTIKQNVLNGEEELLVKNALALIGKGMDAGTVLNDGMIPAMEQIGERFKTGDVFIPEVLLSARAMNRAMAELEPLFAA